MVSRKGVRRWGSKPAAWASIGIACLVVGVGLQARSQDDNFRLLSSAIVGTKNAYVPLSAVPVCGKSLMNVRLRASTTNQDLLIPYLPSPVPRSVDDLAQDQAGGGPLEQMVQGASLEPQLVLWSEGSQRSTVVWHGSLNAQTGTAVPQRVEWLPGTRIAFVRVTVNEGPRSTQQADSAFTANRQSRTTILWVNCATGKTQTLLTGLDANADVLTSDSEPLTLVSSERGSVVRLISPTGSVGPAVKVNVPFTRSSDKILWARWRPDGKSVLGLYTAEDAEGKPVYRRLLLNTQTQEVTEDKEKAVTPPKFVPEPLPFVVYQGQETLTREGVKVTVHPLWLEAADKDTTGRALIAADSDPDFKPVLLTSAVLYKKAGALYAVPLLKADAARFLAKRLDAQKAETLRRARAMGVALRMYAADYDETLPLIAGNLKESVRPYVKDETAFDNPASGQNAFTPAYTNTALGSLAPPATTALGSFAGPDGLVVIIYADGHVEVKGGSSP